ncbi:hypothetical protein BU14_0239s0011 [Porphyra umbilicalis]|uniref:CN hydrolase domain-containing protein n=1 Tax=Porphyra umbilicalis TaxID=2786 RepID=A0A1X6P3K8_PORUM|nr:hypothetical protein BU14_0239s0011 [Porphyra umbilicalis]|eukprot:OSX75356.1 hypothetical protein BU14_0239s0011 [Porphyra umbilicalis]
MLQRAAAAAGAVVVGGSLPEAAPDGSIYNTCVVAGADGAILAVHRKVHLFDIDVPGGVCFKESDALSPGGAVTSFRMADPVGTVGVGICYDVRFPEYAGVLVRERGARLLVYPGAFNSTTGPAHWELLLRARAVDGQCFVVACSPAWGKDGEGGGGRATKRGDTPWSSDRGGTCALWRGGGRKPSMRTLTWGTWTACGRPSPPLSSGGLTSTRSSLSGGTAPPLLRLLEDASTVRVAASFLARPLLVSGPLHSSYQTAANFCPIKCLWPF